MKALHASHHKKYTFQLLFLSVAGLLIIALTNCWVDPYFIWHKHPMWYKATNNSLLDDNQRLAKSMQALTRQPKIVFIGSSCVYHTINPNNAAERDIYNFGIGGLRIQEANAYIRELVKFTPIQKIYFALDLFMFGYEQKTPGFNEKIGTWEGLIENMAGTIFGGKTLRDSYQILTGQSQANDGTWQYNGYKNTPKRSLKEIEAGISAHHELHAKLFKGKNFNDIDNNLYYLEDLMNLCEQHHIRLVLYFNPLNYRLKSQLQTLNVWNHFLHLKASTTQLARQYNVQLFDFSTLEPITSLPFKTEKEIAKNRYFLDTIHGSEQLGNYLMSKLGVKLKENTVAI